MMQGLRATFVGGLRTLTTASHSCVHSLPPLYIFSFVLLDCYFSQYFGCAPVGTCIGNGESHRGKYLAPNI